MSDPTALLTSHAWENKYDEFKAQLAKMDRSQINALNSRGQCALYCAARKGHIPILLDLINHPLIDLNVAATPHGGTPLHAAGFAEYNAAECVGLLIAKGADKERKNSTNLNPRQEADWLNLRAAAEVYELYEKEGIQGLINKYQSIKKLVEQDRIGEKKKSISSLRLNQSGNSLNEVSKDAPEESKDAPKSSRGIIKKSDSNKHFKSVTKSDHDESDKDKKSKKKTPTPRGSNKDKMSSITTTKSKKSFSVSPHKNLTTSKGGSNGGGGLTTQEEKLEADLAIGKDKNSSKGRRTSVGMKINPKTDTEAASTDLDGNEEVKGENDVAKTEDSDDDDVEWCFHVELAEEWRPDCKYVKEIPFIAAPYVPSFFRSHTLYTSTICDDIYISPFEAPLEENFTEEYVDFQNQFLILDYQELEHPDDTLVRQLSSDDPSHWGFQFCNINQLPFTRSNEAATFELCTESKFIIDSSRACNEEEIMLLNSSPFALDSRHDQKRHEFDNMNDNEFRNIYVFERVNDPSIGAEEISPFLPRPLAHLNNLEGFLESLDSMVDSSDCFSIGEVGIYEKLGIAHINESKDFLMDALYLENDETPEGANEEFTGMFKPTFKQDRDVTKFKVPINNIPSTSDSINSGGQTPRSNTSSGGRDGRSNTLTGGKPDELPNQSVKKKSSHTKHHHSKSSNNPTDS